MTTSVHNIMDKRVLQLDCHKKIGKQANHLSISFYFELLQY